MAFNAFKAAEKQYKLWKSAPESTDFSSCLDFEAMDKKTLPADHLGHQVRRVELSNDESTACSSMCGGIEVSPDVEAYSVMGYDGFYFLRGALNASSQRQLAGRGLTEWVEPRYHVEY